MEEIRGDESLIRPTSDFTDNGASDCTEGWAGTCSSSSVQSEAAEMFDSMLCVPASKLVTSGVNDLCSEDIVVFVNAGGSQLNEKISSLKIDGDSRFEGGDVIRTHLDIADTGKCPPVVYQSARYGNAVYNFRDLPSGDYFVDLHFAEIIYTNGPKGMRVFDVFIQGQKVLSEVDIYAVVGANRSLVVLDLDVCVEEDGLLNIRFEGIRGSPCVSGICIRKAKQIIRKCASGAEHSSSLQKRAVDAQTVMKYEKKIQELETLCKQKADECYEAWMLLTDSNEQLEQLKMKLDTRLFQSDSLEQAVRTQTEKLESLTAKYQEDKKFWAAALHDLEAKVQMMKREQTQLSQEAHECASAVPELSQMIGGVQALVTQCEELKLKYSEELAKRKKLYNQVQEAKGNIRVFCRCRPLSKGEIASGCATVVDFDGAKDGDLGLTNGSASWSKKMFKFDRVFSPKDDQVNVFADASPLVASVLDGYNVCIFAYGQTGTGKTFTMEGTEGNRGVNYRTLEELFQIAKAKKDVFTYSITVSVLEVYNEQIRDLLATSPSSKNLKVRQASEGAHHVPGIVEAKVESIKEVWDVLQAGSNARVVGSNNVNEHSSRSHCMLCITVKAKNLVNGECTNSKLWLVDLAGSERLAKTDVQGERLKEAQNINKSLSALGDVISALANKSAHIPYRNSKLTHLLQDSLGGDSKVLMFVQISPSENDYSETLSSLNFATRARGVELGPAKKQIDTQEAQKTKQSLDKAKQECRLKEESLRRMEETCQGLEGKIRNKDQLCRSLQEKLKELEVQLQEKSDLQSLSEKQQHQFSEAIRAKDQTCSVLHLKIKDLEAELKEQRQSTSAKVQELERVLQEKQTRESILEMKIKDLQRKLGREMRYPTPPDDKMEIEEGEDDVSARILRNSNVVSANQESILVKGIDSLHQMKRRREREAENNDCVVSLKERKSTGLRQTTSIDPSKAYGRVTRTTAAAQPQQRPLLSRPKERSTRVWSR